MTMSDVAEKRDEQPEVVGNLTPANSSPVYSYLAYKHSLQDILIVQSDIRIPENASGELNCIKTILGTANH